MTRHAFSALAYLTIYATLAHALWTIHGDIRGLVRRMRGTATTASPEAITTTTTTTTMDKD